MAKEKTSVRMQAQIRKMSEQGYSLRGGGRSQPQVDTISRQRISSSLQRW